MSEELLFIEHLSVIVNKNLPTGENVRKHEKIVFLVCTFRFFYSSMLISPLTLTLTHWSLSATSPEQEKRQAFGHQFVVQFSSFENKTSVSVQVVQRPGFSLECLYG